MYVRIGYRLSSITRHMGTCARICRLGAILGRGTGTSTSRVFDVSGADRSGPRNPNHITYEWRAIDV